MDRRLSRRARGLLAIGLAGFGCMSPTDPSVSCHPAPANRMRPAPRAAYIASLETATGVPP
eukprot:543602-Prymnesium_polylepis.1